MRALYTTFKTSVINASRLIETLRRRGLTLYNVRKKGSKALYFTVNKRDAEKVFAISGELCYNIKRVRSGGLVYPLYVFTKNVGLVLGVAFFVFGSLFSNDFIFSFSFSGSGKMYKGEVEQFLLDKGIDKFTRFSNLDLHALSDEIVKSSEHLSFASCKKRGNVLQIDLALLENSSSQMTGKETNLTADVCGEIESLVVYRGNAIYQVGDRVQKGDVIVNDVVVIKEQELKVNVIATCVIKGEYNFTYCSDLDGQEEYATLLAHGVFGLECVGEKVYKEYINEKYTYTVTLFYRRVYHVG